MQPPGSNEKTYQPGTAKWLRVARIVRPQGHRGEVISDLLTDFPERFSTRREVSLRKPGAAQPFRTASIETFRRHGARIVFRFAGCASMEDAELLRDLEVVVAWEQRAALAEDEVYIAELEGCALIDTRSGETVGVIVDVDRESSNTALLVVAPDGASKTPGGAAELLIPFVKAYAPRWDLEAKTLHMEIPDGLLRAQSAALPDDPEEIAEGKS